jgi:predicted RNase H-like HicB family nuclease
MVKSELTFLISQGTTFLIGRVKEIPEIITQGSDIEEVKSNILDAIELYFEDIYRI